MCSLWYGKTGSEEETQLTADMLVIVQVSSSVIQTVFISKSKYVWFALLLLILNIIF